MNIQQNSTPHDSTQRNLLILLIFFSLVLRLTIFAFTIAHPERPFANPDSGHYNLIARNWIKYHKFLGPVTFLSGKMEDGTAFQGVSFAHEAGLYGNTFIPDSFRTPAYPAYLALIYGIFGQNVSMVIFFQIIMSLLISIILYKIGSMLFNQQAGIIAFILISLNFELLTYPNHLLTETLFIFLITSAVWFLVKFLNFSQTRDIVFSAICIGLSALCRPVALYFPLAVIPVLMLKYRKDLKAFFIYSLICIGVFLLVISPWLARNYAVFGHVRLASIQGYNLYFYNVAFLEAEKNGTYWEKERKQLMNGIQKTIDEQQLNSMEASIVCEKLAKQQINANLPLYIRVHFKGMIKMLVTHSFQTFYALLTDDPYRSGSALSVFLETKSIKRALSAILDAPNPVGLVVLFITIMRGILYGFLLYGAYRAVRTSPIGLVLLLLVIGYFFAVTGPLGCDPRFRIPVVPFMTLLSSYGVAELINTCYPKRARSSDSFKK